MTAPTPPQRSGVADVELSRRGSVGQGGAVSAAASPSFAGEVGVSTGGRCSAPTSPSFEGMPDGLGVRTGIPSPFGSDHSTPARAATFNVAGTTTGGVLPLASGGTTPAVMEHTADQGGQRNPPASAPPLPQPRPSTPFVEVRWCRACNKNRQHDLYGCAMRAYHR